MPDLTANAERSSSSSPVDPEPLGPPIVVLVGHSMGGMAILALAHQHPEWFGLRAAGVLLVATSAGELLHEGLVGLLHRGSRRLGVLPGVLAGLRAAAPAVDRLPWRGSRLGNRFFRWLMFTPDDTADEVRLAQTATEATPLTVDAAFTETLLGFDESAGFAALRTIPTTVVVAQDDRLTPASHGQRIGDALGPNGRLVSVPHAGHAVPQTHPQTVDDALLDLLERVEGSG